jgi:hypothetical protein
MPDINTFLDVAKFISENKDRLKNLDMEVLKDVIEDFAKTHEEELKKLGDKGLDVIFKIIRGRLGDAEIDYMAAIKGKSPATLLEEARRDIREAREDHNGFMNFVMGVSTLSGKIAKAVLKGVGIPIDIFED